MGRSTRAWPGSAPTMPMSTSPTAMTTTRRWRRRCRRSTRIVRAGKARYLGVSNWSAWKVAAAIELQRANGWAPFTHAQMMYSLLGRGIEHEMIRCWPYGLGPHRLEPARRRFPERQIYARKFERRGHPPVGLRHDPVRQGAGLCPGRAHAAIAGAGASVAQVALAWLLGSRRCRASFSARRRSASSTTICRGEPRLARAELAALDKTVAPPAIRPGHLVVRTIPLPRRSVPSPGDAPPPPSRRLTDKDAYER